MIYTVGIEHNYEGTERVDLQFLINYFRARLNSRKLKSIALDTETTGFNPLVNNIITLQLGDSENQFVVDFTRPRMDIALKELIEDNTILGHNLKFDGKFLLKYGIALNKVWDTLIAEGVLTCGLDSPLGLKDICSKYLSINLSKEVRQTFTATTTTLTKEQIEYAAADVQYLHALANAQVTDALKQDLLDCILFENEAMLPIMEIEYNGMSIDTPNWLSNTVKCKKEIVGIENALDVEFLKVEPLARLEGLQLTIFPDMVSDTPRMTGINWASPKQVLAILNNYYGIFPVDKKGNPSSGETPLYSHRKHPFVSLLLEHRGKAKEISTYGNSFITKYLQTDGRVHTSFWQVLDTGRLSSSAPNMQNIPADPDNPAKNYRKFFTTTDDKDLITCDFSSQEPRVTAHYCQDSVLLDFFKQKDADMHSFVASKMFSVINGKPTVITKANPKERAIGKQTGLKLDYGGTAFTLQHMLETTQVEAQKFIDAYWAAFPGKRQYFNKKIHETLQQGYILIDPVLRRKSYLSKYNRWSELRKKYPLDTVERRELMIIKGDMERRAMNYPKPKYGACYRKVA